MKKRILILILLVIMICSISSVGQAFIKKGILGIDEKYTTSYYVIQSGKKGPTIFIVGGTHGDELAGWSAAEKLLKYRPDKGKLVIIPYANKRAVEKKIRFLPSESDLNRAYPGQKDGTIMEKLAYDIYGLIEKMETDLLLDLHESQGFMVDNSKYLGQSIIAYQNSSSIWLALNGREIINQDIAIEKHQIHLLSHPKKGTLTWAVGKNLDIPAFTVETCKEIELDKRIDYQIKVVKGILEQVEVNLSCR